MKKLFIAVLLVVLSLTGFTVHAALDPGEQVIQFEFGIYHAGALTSDGNLYMWGLNSYGQLGDGTTTSTEVPTDITSQFTLDAGESITSIALGGNTSFAITSEGNVWSWGFNAAGQMGDGSTTNSSDPVDVTSSFTGTVVEIVVGATHAGAITTDGTVYFWGSDGNGRLGDGSPAISQSTPVDITSQFGLTGGDEIVDIALGYNFSGAVSDTGRIFMWGADDFGQIGDGGSAYTRYDPYEITSQFTLAIGDKLTDIEAGDYHVLAWSSNNYVFSWGRDTEGQVGNGSLSQADQTTPQLINSYIEFDTGETLLSAALGERHTVTLTSEGRILVWGYNDKGQLGTSYYGTAYQAVDITTQVSLVEGEAFESVTAGKKVSGLLTDDGFVWAWGSNLTLQLGRGLDFYEVNYPILVSTDLDPYLTWTVSFDVDEGSYVPPQYVADTETATLPTPAPTKDGYAFGGWYEDDETFIVLYDFDDPVTADITLYAKWSVSSWVVTFDSDGGSLVDPQYVEYEDYITRPEDPTKSGYNFVGWYEDEELTTSWRFGYDTMPDESITLYAKWTPIIEDVITSWTDGISDFVLFGIAVGTTLTLIIIFALIKMPPAGLLMIAVVSLVTFIALGFIPGWVALIITALVFILGILSLKSRGGGV
jgi:uncharacterized repeat protein (TIGR02543 family)